MISRRDHGAHHKAPFDCKYSIVSGWCTPLLDGDCPGAAGDSVGPSRLSRAGRACVGRLAGFKFARLRRLASCDNCVVLRWHASRGWHWSAGPSPSRPPALSYPCACCSFSAENSVWSKLEQYVYQHWGVEPRSWHEPQADWLEEERPGTSA